MSKLAYLTPDSLPLRFDCASLLLPVGDGWQALFSGALSELAQETSYEQVSGLTPEQTAAIWSLSFDIFNSFGGCPMFAGQVSLSARASAPDGWLLCDGAAYLIAQYPALYNAIGTTYGEDGTGTFRVPDMRSRFPVGAGAGAGLTERLLAASGGEESHTLTTAELAAHQHTSYFEQYPGNPKNGTGSGLIIYWPSYAPADPGTESDTAAAGGDQPHNNMPPFLALNFVVFTGGA